MVIKSQSERNKSKTEPDNSVELSSDDDERKPRFVYRHEAGEVELHLASLECLETDSSYLKDNIIQFYTAYLLYTKSEKSISPRVHIFDSFFSEQLSKVFGNTKIDGPRFKKLRKWYEGVDLFKKDFIVFPFCSSDHWFAIIACYPRNVAYYPPEGPRTDVKDKTPGLIVLDSLGLKCSGHTERVKDLFDFEWRTKCSGVKRFSCLDLKSYFPTLPKQTNTYDCGLYMLAYIECFLQDPDRFYKAAKVGVKNKDAVRKNLDEILQRNTRTELRGLIRKACKQM